MLFECGAIVVVILAAAAMMFRSRSGNGYGVGILPLTLLPLAHMIGKKLSVVISKVAPINVATAYIAIDILALMITCLMLGGISTYINKKSSRVSYLIICGGFSAILCCVLLVNTIII